VAAFAASCSDDESSSNVTNPEGMYVMTAFTVSEPQDLNNDGTASPDIMDETECFENSFVQINSDNTFTASGEGMEINLDENFEAAVACSDEGSYSGTWTMSGNNITMQYTMDGEEVSETFKVTDSTIKFNMDNGTTVGMVDGEPVILVTDIEIVYTKQ